MTCLLWSDSWEVAELDLDPRGFHPELCFSCLHIYFRIIRNNDNKQTNTPNHLFIHAGLSDVWSLAPGNPDWNRSFTKGFVFPSGFIIFDYSTSDNICFVVLQILFQSVYLKRD